MAELDTSGGGGKGGKVRSKKASTRVDLTAMVDLAFLLITFFMLTTSLNKPQAMDMTMPDKEENQEDNLKVADDRTMTVLLGGKNKIEWYMGTVDNPTTPTVIDYGKNGIRAAFLDKIKAVKAATGKDLFVIIKPSDKSSYKNLVDIFDEVNIVDVKQRALADITADEVELLKRDGIY
ncbi:MAG: biopolymer transporter ExbD [Sphingobacteriaceae bacterium]|nr:biopolymer transporter ExbD [Sphingobacteriaceae bacterium]